MKDPVYKSTDGAAEVERRYRALLDRWPLPKTEHRLPTRQGETFVFECGPADAPPVVLLHGSQSNAASWLFDMFGWSKHFRLFAVDMIGEAGFSARVRPPLNSDAHALWLDDVLKGLGIERAALVGISLGGWLALDYANRRPAAVDKLALICPAGIGRQKNFVLRILPLLLLGKWGRQRIVEKVFGPAPRTVPDVAKPFVELMAAVRRAIRPRYILIPRLNDSELEALKIPMLVIVGGRDVLIDSDHSRARLATHAPHADVRYLPEGYHFLPGQAATVQDFLLSAPAA